MDYHACSAGNATIGIRANDSLSGLELALQQFDSKLDENFEKLNNQLDQITKMVENMLLRNGVSLQEFEEETQLKEPIQGEIEENTMDIVGDLKIDQSSCDDSINLEDNTAYIPAKFDVVWEEIEANSNIIQDTANESMGSGMKKRAQAQYGIFNFVDTSVVTLPQMMGNFEKQSKVGARMKTEVIVLFPSFEFFDEYWPPPVFSLYFLCDLVAVYCDPLVITVDDEMRKYIKGSVVGNVNPRTLPQLKNVLFPWSDSVNDQFIHDTFDGLSDRGRNAYYGGNLIRVVAFGDIELLCSLIGSVNVNMMVIIVGGVIAMVPLELLVSKLVLFGESLKIRLCEDARIFEYFMSVSRLFVQYRIVIHQSFGGAMVALCVIQFILVLEEFIYVFDVEVSASNVSSLFLVYYLDYDRMRLANENIGSENPTLEQWGKGSFKERDVCRCFMADFIESRSKDFAGHNITLVKQILVVNVTVLIWAPFVKFFILSGVMVNITWTISMFIVDRLYSRKPACFYQGLGMEVCAFARVSKLLYSKSDSNNSAMDGDNIQQSLLYLKTKQKEGGVLKGRIRKETKKIWKIATLGIIFRLSSFGTIVVTQSFIGHIISTDLAAYALVQTLSICFINGILIGMSSATETLCCQVYDAKQYHMMGIYLQRSLIIDLITMTILIAREAGIALSTGYISLWFIPFVYALIFSLTIQMYLQAKQKNMVITWLAALQFEIHVALSWLFVYVLDFGVPGAMSTMWISSWFVVLGEFVYVFGEWYLDTWKGFTIVAMKDLWPVGKLSVSAGLIMELWCYAILVLFAGYVKNAKVAIYAFSICLNISTWIIMIIVGFMGAVEMTKVLLLVIWEEFEFICNTFQNFDPWGQGSKKRASIVMIMKWANARVGLILIIIFIRGLAHFNYLFMVGLITTFWALSCILKAHCF